MFFLVFISRSISRSLPILCKTSFFVLADQSFWAFDDTSIFQRLRFCLFNSFWLSKFLLRRKVFKKHLNRLVLIIMMSCSLQSNLVYLYRSILPRNSPLTLTDKGTYWFLIIIIIFVFSILMFIPYSWHVSFNLFMMFLVCSPTSVSTRKQ